MSSKWYPFALAGYDGDFFIHSAVRAADPVKAARKARRIQLRTGWPLLSMAPEHQISTGEHYDWRRIKKERRKGNPDWAE